MKKIAKLGFEPKRRANETLVLYQLHHLALIYNFYIIEK